MFINRYAYICQMEMYLKTPKKAGLNQINCFIFFIFDFKTSVCPNLFKTDASWL